MDLLTRFNTAIDVLERRMNTEDIYYWNRQMTLFVSLGQATERACVVRFQGKNLQSVADQARHWLRKQPETDWLKLDIARNFEATTFEALQVQLRMTRKNYFRRGISFDRKMQCAYLEEELNGNAVLTKDPTHDELHVNLTNLTNYTQHQGRTARIAFHPTSPCLLFETLGVFAGETPHVLEVTRDVEKIRDTTSHLPSEIKTIVAASSRYLARQVQTNGRFQYGYFPCFDKPIRFYNSLRHASTLYSMIEAYRLAPDEILRDAIDRAKRYLIDELIVLNGELAFVLDRESNEIKLGANAAAILALTEYMQTFGTTQDLHVSRQLAEGILSLQQTSGQYLHVLEYPSFQLKDAFRIIYYEGEATYALMRLYALDPDSRWLDSVVRSFDHFLAHAYWKYHDHWLSYSANELTKQLPEARYFQFGLQNVAPKLDFIHHRETTYPTFLELMLAAREMIDRMEALGQKALLADFPLEWLDQTIERRMVYQRNGFFYPEVAMYMKKPDRILGSFYIRHHSMRVRIDDVEHNLSGYCRAWARMLKEVPS
ncbi:poly(glycerol-phosphate) alpha-glucosyltransferase [Exiguobacterium sp. TDN 0502]|uniref:poly(glycerol-phosphate) alpha-glucosyltransferase n=1 Tax=Exiguobacterium sp. TDN 0502 TaxID=3420731 RepID=UPI003D7818E4